MRRIAIVTPVLNDWLSLGLLLKDVDSLLRDLCETILVLAVDDGSVQKPPATFTAGLSSKLKIKIIQLSVNLGHQRAIAVGLSVVDVQNLDVDCVIVMDSDGEDRPADILPMLNIHDQNSETIVVAKRTKRSETLKFRLFYMLYKITFQLLTGTKISHGNFCLIPAQKIDGLLHTSHTWNNLAASILRSRLLFTSIPTERGKRYEGQSRMNFISLLLHGLSAVSVYLDVITARILAACFAAIFCVSAATIGVISIRLFTNLAIPGWTTNVLGFFAIITMQILMISAGTLFSHLNSRSQPSVIPASTAPSYINKIIDL